MQIDVLKEKHNVMTFKQIGWLLFVERDGEKIDRKKSSVKGEMSSFYIEGNTIWYDKKTQNMEFHIRKSLSMNIGRKEST